MLRAFFRLNKKCSYWVQQYLPYRKMHVIDHYLKEMEHQTSKLSHATVLDVGCGEECPYAKFRRGPDHFRIAGYDILADALEKNTDIDDKYLGDANQALPMTSESVDLITSRMVLEHLEDNNAFFTRAVDRLKPGGMFVHVFPAKYALFAIINRILPKAFARKVLFYFFPENEGSGFTTFYDQCSYLGMKRMLLKHGFEIERIDSLYFASNYFAFFFPLYLLSVCYEMLAWILGLKNLAAYHLIVAKKPQHKQSNS